MKKRKPLSERLRPVAALVAAAMLVAVPVGIATNGDQEQDGVESVATRPSAATPASVTDGRTKEAKATTRNVVEAKSATENIVGDIFARAVNESMAGGDGARESLFDEETLEEYPVESHNPEFYADTHRLRRLVSDDGTDVGFLAYRDSLLIVPHEEASSYDVSWSDDGESAYVNPAPDPEELEGKDGLVLIRDNVGNDDIMMFDGSPRVEGDTLVTPVKTADELSFNQLFSDGSISYSSRTSKSPLDAPLTSATEPVLQSPGDRRLLGDSPSIENLIGMDFTPSGTNWSCRLSNPSLGDIGADYDIDIWDVNYPRLPCHV